MKTLLALMLMAICCHVSGNELPDYPYIALIKCGHGNNIDSCFRSSVITIDSPGSTEIYGGDHYAFSTVSYRVDDAVAYEIREHASLTAVNSSSTDVLTIKIIRTIDNAVMFEGEAEPGKKIEVSL